MVCHHPKQQTPSIGGQADEAGAHQRRLGQVGRLGGGGRQPAPCVLLVGTVPESRIRCRQVSHGVPMDGAVGLLFEGGAQGGVVGDQAVPGGTPFLNRGLPRRHFEHPDDMMPHARQAKAMGQPEIGLAHGGGPLVLCAAIVGDSPAGRQMGRQAAHRQGGQHILHRGPMPLGLQAQGHLNGAQAGTAQTEEIIVTQDEAWPQHGLPGGGHSQFQIALGQGVGRRDTGRALVAGQRQQGLAIDLAGAAGGQTAQGDDPRGHHVGRQQGREIGRPVGAGRYRAGHESHQAAVHQHDAGMGDAGVAGQRALDLRQSHRLAGDLDHVVATAQRLQQAIVAPAAHVAGAVRPAEGGVDKGARGQVRLVEIAGRQALTQDMDLAHITRGHRDALAIQDEDPNAGEGPAAGQAVGIGPTVRRDAQQADGAAHLRRAMHVPIVDAGAIVQGVGDIGPLPRRHQAAQAGRHVPVQQAQVGGGERGDADRVTLHQRQQGRRIVQKGTGGRHLGGAQIQGQA
ncbi:hypothetical protein AZA_81431 [Nitrospirillum viridazoti Y2]|nr:hypothetical protein AZA_81431 [Nitrospirillum amazonense Y2]